MAVAERLTRQLEAGFRQQGVEVRTASTEPFADAATVLPSLAGSRKILLVRLSDVWIDFANPIGGNESILYFDATAQVIDPAGKVLASNTRKFQRNFRYNINDSFFNQAVWTLKPEFAALIGQPSIQRALAR
jgi:outer membrane lipopolysaccharide assembly protein LptE/RlpB